MNSNSSQTFNDFGITISTVNGSGSTTANNIILKSIFKMGIPVSARNIFPSNIQGMPTWYHLRVSQAGYLGRFEKPDILVAMNPQTISEDLASLKEGGTLLLNARIGIPENDSNYLIKKIPVDTLLKEADVPSNLSLYLANMVYVGVLASLIGIDLSEIKSALMQHFGGKTSAVNTNMDVINKSYQWEKNTGDAISPNLLKAEEADKKKIMVDGNTASALGSLYGGLQFAAWYPITPATSLPESLIEYIPKLRTEPDTGISSCAIVQAEDELAAIGMVIGAGWSGLRSMTATSGPGLCLMSEFLGLAYFAEIPAVVWDVQRVGPSTGLPTHTSQGDLAFAHSLGHGDTEFIILLPSTVGECFEFGWRALDIADRMQAPIIVLSDLDLGMNLWMSGPFEYPRTPIDKGKILWENGLDDYKEKYTQKYGRYLDVDGDGIPYRTVPGNMHPDAAYFTRGTGHDEKAHYSEKAETWEENLNRLKRKFEKAKEIIPEPIVERNHSSAIGIIAYGSTHFPVFEAVQEFSNNVVDLDYLRIRALPCGSEVKTFIKNHKKVIVIENNRDGQLLQILCSVYPKQASKFVKLSKCDGMSLSAKWIIEKLEELKLEKEV